MNEMMIALKGVSKNYRIKNTELKVLDDISLDIPKGTFLSVKGPSGAGKSTLLYIMGMLLSSDRGEVLISGKAVRTMSGREKARIRNRDIGFIFQSYHLMPEFSALENIIMPALLSGIARKEAVSKAESFLERVNLKGRGHHKPSELSGGEQQRACICRALINNPGLILADEPTGNLDSGNADIVMNLLESLCSEHMTSLVIVTHNETLASRAHKKVSILDGKIHE